MLLYHVSQQQCLYIYLKSVSVCDRSCESPGFTGGHTDGFLISVVIIVYFSYQDILLSLLSWSSMTISVILLVLLFSKNQ